jgi:spermidine synthase
MRQDASRPPARVRVRESARGRELSVDGTFASLWRPGRVTTGSVWDALAAPLLALERLRSPRMLVLVLGLGGGSIARIARALLPDAHIVGVELDPDVIDAARRHFELDALGLEVVQADARAFLGRERRLFDAVVDDVFVGRGSAVRKPDWLPDPGLALCAKRVRPGGVLATNNLDEAARAARTLSALLGPVTTISVMGYDNRILAAGPASLTPRSLRAAVALDPVLGPTLPQLVFRAAPT